ncbi:5'-3' exonuclease PLD3 isoform X2 [Trichomycterus rosablanca]|uniref:5'-3' exonuclease PLD3 isoform X2 n=1 Tax=Trichomycterus rosablanca TaxID=2290929 RepID=UPI002F35B51F
METEDDIGTAEHNITMEDEKRMEGEESRKAGRPSSRIPTFQSSLARKRTTPHIAESLLPTKAEGSPQDGQMKDRGEPLRTKLPVLGDKEMPILSSHLQSSSTDDLLFSGSSDATPVGTLDTALHLLRQDHSPEPETCASGDSEGCEELLQRPSIRADTESCATESHSEPELQSTNTESLSEDEKESEPGLQEELSEKLEEFIHTIKDELERREVKETSPVEDEASKQYPVSENTKTLPMTASKTSLKEKLPYVPAKSATVHSSQVECVNSTSERTRGGSFALFCLLPSILLLLGGFGQHVWLYGVPRSVSHLMVQLEMHWLEGFWLPQEECSTDCGLTLVESIPEGMHYPSGSPHLQSISHTWTHLLNRANSSVDIAAFYLTLRDSDIGLTDPTSMQGKELFRLLKQLEPKGVNLKIAVNAPQTYIADTDELAATGAEVREIDLQSITGGIVHTKLWAVDKKHMYVGSANMDWRSLTQVKEVGVSIEDCSCLAQDASRIFGVYWEVGAQKNSSPPSYWPGRFSALSSIKYPLTVKFNGVPARVYLSSAPPQLSTYGRTDDLAAILSIIADAKEFVYVSVMDYIPMSQFTQPIRFWPAIDSALRDAACARGVKVNLLVSCWSHSPGAMFIFLQSLSVLSKSPLSCNIHVKVFEVPHTPEQLKIPFARVNHAKYMVTDRVVYIGTSNWSENYFSQTAGVGLVVNQTGSVVEKGQQTVQNELHKIFQRDWNSDFAQTLTTDHGEFCNRKKKT